MFCINSWKRWLKKLISSLQERAKKHFNTRLKMSAEDEQKLKQAEKCHICGRSYKQGDIGVREHCHIAGKYRGSAHQDLI